MASRMTASGRVGEEDKGVAVAGGDLEPGTPSIDSEISCPCYSPQPREVHKYPSFSHNPASTHQASQQEIPDSGQHSRSLLGSIHFLLLVFLKLMAVPRDPALASTPPLQIHVCEHVEMYKSKLKSIFE
ncbi:hypothetical protein CB1_040024001 [Camelus ferus]|nr:hypothetical protein CB1_040024001 [Camelus ferus]